MRILVVILIWFSLCNSREPYSELECKNTMNHKKEVSDAWKYFSKLREKENSHKARCNICLTLISHHGNTTNLLKHIKRKHSANSVLEQNTQNESTTNNTLREDSTSSNDNFTSNKKRKKDGESDLTSNSPKRPTLTIVNAFEKQKSYQEGGVKYGNLTNAILYMIAVDDNPLSLSEKRGFKHFIKVAAPSYTPPSRKTITKLMDDKFETLSNKLKIFLGKEKHTCLTTDCWTDFNAKSFLGLTAHYTKNFKIESVNLGAFPLEERHTSDYLGDKLYSLCTEWNIAKSSIVAIITDNAANIVKAVCDKYGSTYHFGCFAHSIQLVPEMPIKKLQTLLILLKKLKLLLRFVKKSSNAADNLRRLQMEGGKSEGELLKVIQQEDSRWNTTYYMLERFIIMSPIISSVLFNIRNAPEMLSTSEIDILKDIMEILQPIEQITRELSSEDVTCSKIIPMVKCLTAFLDQKIPTTLIGETFETNLKISVENRFKDIEIKKAIWSKATLLDPRFKKLYFQPLNLIKIQADIKAEVKCLQTVKSCIKAPEVSEIYTNNNKKSDNLWEFHDLTSSSLPKRDESEQEITPELNRFLQEPLAPRTINPIAYWEEVKHRYPNLYPVAIKYLSIPATSVPCERLFSKAGLIETKRRNRLCPERLSKLIFLSSLTAEQWEI